MSGTTETLVLLLNGEQVGNGVSFYFAMMMAEESGYKPSFAAINALASGSRKYSDSHGDWEVKKGVVDG